MIEALSSAVDILHVIVCLL